MEDINNGITYVFGENADLEADINADWIGDFFYYKNTPLWKDVFAFFRNAFWNVLTPIIALFNQ